MPYLWSLSPRELNADTSNNYYGTIDSMKQFADIVAKMKKIINEVTKPRVSV